MYIKYMMYKMVSHNLLLGWSVFSECIVLILFWCQTAHADMSVPKAPPTVFNSVYPAHPLCLFSHSDSGRMCAACITFEAVVITKKHSPKCDMSNACYFHLQISTPD
uniref:LO1a n=1 Tax=Carp adomavirus TaxID=2609874 RepID=A0A6F9EY53_9VIRU|nr:TPA_asm: LO1a [Carp adomavirus]